MQKEAADKQREISSKFSRDGALVLPLPPGVPDGLFFIPSTVTHAASQFTTRALPFLPTGPGQTDGAASSSARRYFSFNDEGEGDVGFGDGFGLGEVCRALAERGVHFVTEALVLDKGPAHHLAEYALVASFPGACEQEGHADARATRTETADQLPGSSTLSFVIPIEHNLPFFFYPGSHKWDERLHADAVRTELTVNKGELLVFSQLLVHGAGKVDQAAAPILTLHGFMNLNDQRRTRKSVGVDKMHPVVVTSAPENIGRPRSTRAPI